VTASFWYPRAEVRTLSVRFVAIALVSALLAAAGFVAEVAIFGVNGEATAARLEREVRRTVAERTAAAESLAEAVAADAPLIAAATTSHERLSVLFERLLALSAPDGEHGAAATIYVPSRGSGDYDVLA
jgi:hypothetical protein